MVRTTGFEPAVSWTRTKRSTKLSYVLIDNRLSLNFINSNPYFHIKYKIPAKWHKLAKIIKICHVKWKKFFSGCE